ncbi:MAG: autotransporter domain-containing protein, partial [Alphaproteobacteria bacterium]|nr:autotransporter domain-containing protein [Alphaproteobacteria bacterium]
SLRGILAKGTESKIVIGSASDYTNSLTISNSNTSSGPDDRGIRAENGGTVEVYTDNLTITGTDTSYALHARGGADSLTTKIMVNAKNVDITSKNSPAINANNTKIRPEETYATTQVDIVADNINISSDTTAVSAMSQGIVNITGNTVLNAKNAILGRGDAQININTTDLTKTLVMNGNIDFNYHHGTSQSSIDADINVALNGSNSSWTGNTVMSWDSKPADADKLIVSNATVTLNDGASWNATKITASDTMEQISLNNLIVNKGTINVADGADALVDNLTVTDLTLNGKVTADTVTFEAGSKLTTALDDTTKIEAGKVSIGDGSTLNLIIDGAIEEKSYNFIESSDITGAFTIADNGLYSFTQDSTGTITASKKSAEDIASDTGASIQDATALLAIVNADGSGSDQGNALASALSTALQSGDAVVAVQAVKEAAPTTAQVVSGLAKEAANTIAQVSTARLDSIKGTNGGDTVTGAGLWVQGLYNHTKQSVTSSSDGFKANSHGLAIGADTELSETTTLGLGYGYMETDADSTGRDIEVDSHNLFVYGEYQPSEWYVNAVLNYGFSKYKEDKAPLGVALKSKYDVKSYGASIMTGYDFDGGITPEVGMRYLVVDAESYNDGAQDINSKKNDVLTAVAGIKYTTNVKTEKAILKPTVRVAATYDIVSDNDEASIQVIGGGNYTVSGQRLHRFGVEAGAGVTATVNNWDFTLEYNGAFREDYRSQGGIIKARYNF